MFFSSLYREFYELLHSFFFSALWNAKLYITWLLHRHFVINFESLHVCNKNSQLHETDCMYICQFIFLYGLLPTSIIFWFYCYFTDPKSYSMADIFLLVFPLLSQCGSWAVTIRRQRILQRLVVSKHWIISIAVNHEHW